MLGNIQIIERDSLSMSKVRRKLKNAPFLRTSFFDDMKEEVFNVVDNYEELWKRLNEKYGDIGKLVDLILFQIKSLSLEKIES